MLRELGIGFVAYSPFGRGILTGTVRSLDDLADSDFRRTNPRFTGENFQRNLESADEVQSIADEVGCTPAQVSLAWLLAKGDDIAPIPGTKRVSRLEENVAADGIELSPEQLDRLDKLTPVSRRAPQRRADADDRTLTLCTSDASEAITAISPERKCELPHSTGRPVLCSRGARTLGTSCTSRLV